MSVELKYFKGGILSQVAFHTERIGKAADVSVRDLGTFETLEVQADEEDPKLVVYLKHGTIKALAQESDKIGPLAERIADILNEEDSIARERTDGSVQGARTAITFIASKIVDVLTEIDPGFDRMAFLNRVYRREGE